MLHKPELLAPAGTWDSLVAAVENGADAVYLGGTLFSARASAGNFNNEEIERAVYFAHVRGVKIYVTVNILLDQQELLQAVRFLHFLQGCGVDAVIVQDLGLAGLAQKVIPELPVHASTQMTIHNLPAARLLKENGIDRVVLARELPLTEIREIVRQSGLEVEVFVHGALCVCYSGQCLMSSLIGGRSGNRGRCAQPCRLKYTLVDNTGRPLADPQQTGEYLLSPRDLNMSAHLPDLAGAGITALKIEGRMKRPEYVATVVRIYRRLLDRAVSGGDFSVEPEEARQLAQIFNRDFTTGYFYNRPGREMMSWKRPNNRGVRLGRVKGFNRQSRLAEVQLESPLRVGDGIEVWVSDGGRAVGKVNRIMLGGKSVERAPAKAVVQLDINGRVFPGDRVFKTHDADLIEQARASFTSPKEAKKIPLAFTVTARLGEPLHIEVRDPVGFTGEAYTASPAAEAINRPLTFDYLKKQLDRLGNTPFALGSLDCRLEGRVMAPVSELNEARREALAQLESRRAAGAKSRAVPEEIFNSRLSQALDRNLTAGRTPDSGVFLSVTVGDLPSLRAAVKAGAKEVHFGGEQFKSKPVLSLADIYEGSETCRKSGVAFILASPRIMREQELQDFCRLLEGAPDSLDGLLTGNMGLIRKAGEITGAPVFADFPLHVFNHEAAIFLKKAGVKRITLSPELTLEQIRRLVPLLPLPAEAIVHGTLPLMVSEYCAPGSLLGDTDKKGSRGTVLLLPDQKDCTVCRGKSCGLKDRKGVVFPVETDRQCRMHIFNSRDLCLIEDLAAIRSSGVSVLRIEAGRQGPDYVRDVVKSYQTALALPLSKIEEATAGFKDIMQKYSPAGFTKGHYYRGVT
jgi:putative protease